MNVLVWLILSIENNNNKNKIKKMCKFSKFIHGVRPHLTESVQNRDWLSRGWTVECLNCYTFTFKKGKKKKYHILDCIFHGKIIY